MNVAIIGGGPAGAMLAHRLGKAGVVCTLFEKNGAWEKPCGGGLPSKARENIREIHEFEGPYNEITLGEFVAPSGLSITLDSKRPMWIVSRKILGAHLLNLATYHDSVTFKKEAVKEVRREKSGFTVVAEKEESFDFVAGADGCRSKVGKLVKRTIPKEFITTCVGFFIEAKNDKKATSWLLNTPGYLWAFPRPDAICVGGGSSDSRLSIFTYSRTKIARRFPGRKILSKWAAPIPFIRDPSLFDLSVCGKNWALLGDAAMHVDALTGEGIYYALLDGCFLAEAIIDEKPEKYDSMWRDSYYSHLHKSSLISSKYYKPKMMEKIFRIANGSKTMRGFLTDMLSEQPDYVKAGKDFSRLSRRVLLEYFRSRL